MNANEVARLISWLEMNLNKQIAELLCKGFKEGFPYYQGKGCNMAKNLKVTNLNKEVVMLKNEKELLEGRVVAPFF